MTDSSTTLVIAAVAWAVIVIAGYVWMGFALGALLRKLGGERVQAWVPVVRWMAAARAARLPVPLVAIARGVGAVGWAVVGLGVVLLVLQAPEVPAAVRGLLIVGGVAALLGSLVGWAFWIYGSGTIELRLRAPAGLSWLAAASPVIWASVLGWGNYGRRAGREVRPADAAASAVRAMQPGVSPAQAASAAEVPVDEAATPADDPPRDHAPAGGAGVIHAAESVPADRPMRLSEPAPPAPASAVSASAASAPEARATGTDGADEDTDDIAATPVWAALVGAAGDRPAPDGPSEGRSAKSPAAPWTAVHSRDAITPGVDGGRLVPAAEPETTPPASPAAPQTGAITVGDAAAHARASVAVPPGQALPSDPVAASTPEVDQTSPPSDDLPPYSGPVSPYLQRFTPTRPADDTQGPDAVPAEPLSVPEPVHEDPAQSDEPAPRDDAPAPDASPELAPEPSSDSSPSTEPVGKPRDAGRPVPPPWAAVVPAVQASAPAAIPPSQPSVEPPASQRSAPEPAPAQHPPAAPPAQPSQPSASPASQASAAAPVPAPPSQPSAPPPAQAPPVTLKPPPPSAPSTPQPEPASAAPVGPQADDSSDDDHTIVVARRQPWVLAVTGGERYSLPGGSVIVGRSTGSPAAGRFAIVDSTRTMSKVHAELTLREGAWLVRDLGSTNGTFIRHNGRETKVEGSMQVPADGILLLGDLEARILKEGESR